MLTLLKFWDLKLFLIKLKLVYNMALVKACIVGNSVKNTGKECDVAMGPTAMIICVPSSTVITEDDLADPLEWIRPLLHADKQSRVYPLFGSVAPINTITNDQEADV